MLLAFKHGAAGFKANYGSQRSRWFLFSHARKCAVQATGKSPSELISAWLNEQHYWVIAYCDKQTFKRADNG